jgi:hypothetical protein
MVYDTFSSFTEISYLSSQERWKITGSSRRSGKDIYFGDRQRRLRRTWWVSIFWSEWHSDQFCLTIAPTETARKQFYAHGNAVIDVKWSKDDEHLVILDNTVDSI